MQHPPSRNYWGVELLPTPTAAAFRGCREPQLPRQACHLCSHSPDHSLQTAGLILPGTELPMKSAAGGVLANLPGGIQHLAGLCPVKYHTAVLNPAQPSGEFRARACHSGRHVPGDMAPAERHEHSQFPGPVLRSRVLVDVSPLGRPSAPT